MPHIPTRKMTKITIFPAQYCVPVVGECGAVQFKTIWRKQKHNQQKCLAWMLNHPVK